MKIHSEFCIKKDKGFSFALIPVITFDKRNEVNANRYELLFGLFFWYIEFSWRIINKNK